LASPLGASAGVSKAFKTSVVVLACAIAVLVFAVYALLSSAARKHQVEESVQLAGQASNPPVVRSPHPVSRSGTGAISGEVSLTGQSPNLPPLKVGADPVCARLGLRDEQVLVKNGKLQNVVVRVSKNATSEAPSGSPVAVDQQGCIYRPRVQGAMVGQQLVIRNSDPILHNVHAYRDSSTLFNWAQPPQSTPREIRLDRPGQIVKLRCDVHPWMISYIVVTDNPFFATTGEDGAFKISGLPEGEYELQAWHERYGVQQGTVQVRPDEIAHVAFNYRAGPE
jgi:hypothetical protein